uniref:NADH-ubiquinone oxidoreductase chain 2 n=1 Tax=Heloderma suspectum TaxID=8554 RepID=Q94V78_HELSU|nr:NADH dehydrogenase subunit 2 [Heloderma suspectum]
MNPMIMMILIFSITTGTIITMSSQHWLLAWMGLELNTLAVIPIISKKHHPRATEAATKYFLIQAGASAMILFSSIINAWFMGQWDILQLSDPLAKTLLTIALMMKLGLTPLHFWFPEVLQGSSLTTALILATWQKLAPMTLLYMTAHQISTTILLIIGTMSTIVGGLGGLNQTQLREMMAFSSIAHLGWMTAVITLSTNLAMFNLVIYILITTNTFMIFISLSTKTIKDMGTTLNTTPMLATMLMIVLLSMGGLPPLSGFLPKWLILQELTTQNLLPVAILMAMATLLNLFFYLRLAYTTALTLPPNAMGVLNNWRFKAKSTSLLLTTTFPLSIMMTPLMPIIQL